MKKFLLLLSIITIGLCYSCFIEPETEEHSSLYVTRFPLPPGDENCPNGGIGIETGIDENGNGILDRDEVDRVEYVCNGQDGYNSLIAIADEPAGINCSLGGKKIDVGLDTNRNSVLDPDEVTGTSYICLPEDGPSDIEGLFWTWNDENNGTDGWEWNSVAWTPHGYNGGGIECPPTSRMSMDPPYDAYWNVTIYRAPHNFNPDVLLPSIQVDLWTENGILPQSPGLGEEAVRVEMDWAPSGGAQYGPRRMYNTYTSEPLGNGWYRLTLNLYDQWMGNTGLTQLYLGFNWTADPGIVRIDNYGYYSN